MPDNHSNDRGSPRSTTRRGTTRLRRPVGGPTRVIGRPSIINPRLTFRFTDPIGNFFDAARPGEAVVRPEDMLTLRIELHNLTIQPGSPPRLKKTGRGAAYLTLHFPPQAITEQTFFETKPKGTSNPPPPVPGTPEKPEPSVGGSETLTGPPVRARISGESRLVFVVPNDFAADYTLAGVLDAVERLSLSVPPAARPPGAGLFILPIGNIFAADLSRLSASQRAALSSYALRTLRIALLQTDMPTVHMRQAIGGPGLRPVRRAPGDGFTRIGVNLGPVVRRPARSWRPALPGRRQTAIELPWRLIISPHGAEGWRHAKHPVTSTATRHTELWHSRLVAPRRDGSIIEPPRPDNQRTVRAVWALTGEGSTQAMQSDFPASLPLPHTIPFRMPLDDFDRFQIAHLSSNFSNWRYRPAAVGVDLLMLSALGGWLDARGAWDPPAGFSVEEWVHRAAMARDHYVRVVYKGFLFPFGHRVALVKVSERKFHNGARGAGNQPTIEYRQGNTAYLRQRLFIVIRERERRYIDPTLTVKSGKVYLHRQFPFTRIRILTTVTPNLDRPDAGDSEIVVQGESKGQTMFWPYVNGQPFAFQCAATDLDGRSVTFELPMIFMDNTLVNPGPLNTAPNYGTAETHAMAAGTEWNTTKRQALRTAGFKQQRVALAQSVKAGDTTVQADEISFDAEIEAGNTQLRGYSLSLSRPIFYPKVTEAQVRIAALAQLTGSAKNNTIQWNGFYLEKGFAASNRGQVFVDVVPQTDMAQLDFSTQGDRSGGFVQPNLKPSAISRLSGPVAGTVGDFISGTFTGADAFPASISDLPLPLLFGCIPLGEVIEAVANLADTPERIPKFASEAGTQVEEFIGSMAQLFGMVSRLSDQSGRIAEGAVAVAKNTLQDLIDQTQAYAASLVADLQSDITALVSALNGLLGQVQLIKDTTIDIASGLPGLAAGLASVQAAAATLQSTANAQVNGVFLPSGLRQSVLQVAAQLQTFTGDLAALGTLLNQGKALYTALDAVVGQPDQLGDLLSTPAQLEARLKAIQAALTPLRATLADFRLLAGAPRQAVLKAIDALVQILDSIQDLTKILEMLTGDELTVRFDWNPTIANWALPGVDPNQSPLFRANDKKGFLVAVEAKVKKNGQSTPKIGVVCSLKHFDLVLIAPASFIELNFEKVEFRVDSGAKMDVDVLLTDIKFVGPLSFVETLRDLIPLDGFSDPPFLDITPQGIDAGFSLALPNISVGVFNLANLSLGAGFTVPFIGQPVAVRFNFCTREQPFNLTVSLFGGGGFFGITIDPHGVQILEAALEFGASISINFGVASGGVHVMAGIYFRMEMDACSLTGYFRLGGHVSVLGLISASIELYLELRYEFESGKCVGKAQLTIEVEVFLFSVSVTITCERKFAGSNGDPTFRELVGFQPEMPLEDELNGIDNSTDYPWREYCEAFA